MAKCPPIDPLRQYDWQPKTAFERKSYVSKF